MYDLLLLYFSVAITLIGMVLIAMAPSKAKAGLNTILVILNACVTSLPAIHALTGHPVEFIFGGISFFGNIPIRIDALSAWFILIINFTSINGALYGIGYMKPYAEQKANLSLHWMLFLIFHSSMLWVCMIQNSLAFLVAWELMSLSSLLLVIFEYQNKNTLKAGLNYLVQMHISVVFLTTAFIWMYFVTGSFDFSSIGLFFLSNRNIWLFLLFFTGFGIKAGFIPLHSLLPHAHPAAPSHISGVMSGVIVKLGIYGIKRIALFLKQDFVLIGEIILSLSVVTGLYGILNAAVNRDFKKMLAYCTIENIGTIGAGIGLGIMGIGFGNTTLLILGFAGALLHTLNHLLFKSLLFFSAGSVYQQTHTRDMEKLDGLLKPMPQIGFLFLMGGLAIGGLPPFKGFVSEFLLYSGTLEGIRTLDVSNATLMIFSLAGLAIIGGISLLAFSKVFGAIFLGSARTRLKHEPTEVSRIMLIPQYLILLIMISIGIFPGFYFSLTLNPFLLFLSQSHVDDMVQFQPMMATLTRIGMYSLLLVGTVGVIYFIRVWIIDKRVSEIRPTWGCAYVAPNTRMQYTGKSFSKSLGKLLSFIVLENKRYTEIPVDQVFPTTRKHSSHYIDFIENRIFNGILNRLVFSMNYFNFIQNGKTQAYVLYGLFFILLVFLGTIFNFI